MAAESRSGIQPKKTLVRRSKGKTKVQAEMETDSEDGIQNESQDEVEV